jgi:hypothetical protein
LSLSDLNLNLFLGFISNLLTAHSVVFNFE